MGVGLRRFAGLSASKITATSVASSPHRCLNCGYQLHAGDEIIWAHTLNGGFCLGCADESLLGRAVVARNWHKRKC